MGRFFILAMSLLTVFGIVCPRLACAELVQVVTTRGRTLAGEFDARTDDNRLWLRQQRGEAVLTSSVSWADVAVATLGDNTVNTDDLRQRRHELMSPAPQWSAAIAPDAARQAAPRAVEQRGPHVRSLEIVSACLANFDHDVEPDGLTVSIAALDHDGAPMAVRGNLRARLYGELRPGSVRDVTFGTLDEWTQRVTAGDFASGIATYEFKFRHTAPEWQFDMLPDTVVEVSLLAYGEGRFSASEPVVIRAFNPLRDNQQLLFKSRFLPGEHHGPPPSSMPMNRDGLWLHWTW